MAETALATPPETKMDRGRTMSAAAEATHNLIVDPAIYADPDQLDAAFRKLRAEDPLAWCEPEHFRPFWAVTKHADIMEISRQNKLFTNGEREMLSYEDAEKGVYAQMGGPHLLKTLVQLDDPLHFKLRHLTQEWFMPQNVKKREDAIRQIAKKYVDRMEDLGGECDFQRDVALYYPLRVIMQILGVPESDEPMMLKLTQEIFGAQDEDLMRDKTLAEQQDVEKGLASINETLAEFFMYFTGITADRRANPKDDVSTVIANGMVDGERLLLCYPSGNRDEDVFDDPYTFDISRSPNKLISFGHGGHMCLGMHLARLEMQAIYEELFSRLKSIELAGDPTFIKANFVGGPKSIPVRYKF